MPDPKKKMSRAEAGEAYDRSATALANALMAFKTRTRQPKFDDDRDSIERDAYYAAYRTGLGKGESGLKEYMPPFRQRFANEVATRGHYGPMVISERRYQGAPAVDAEDIESMREMFTHPGDAPSRIAQAMIEEQRAL
ncbi:MAG: hypothetical protein ACO32I_08275 [Candidatus Limnocylindrus sp.]